MESFNPVPEPGTALVDRALPEVRCKELRSKDIIMNLGFHPSGMDSIGTPCWCFRTQQVFGPDGRQANKWDCAPGRECYEPIVSDS
jgi:hypothetical protein